MVLKAFPASRRSQEPRKRVQPDKLKLPSVKVTSWFLPVFKARNSSIVLNYTQLVELLTLRNETVLVHCGHGLSSEDAVVYPVRTATAFAIAEVAKWSGLACRIT